MSDTLTVRADVVVTKSDGTEFTESHQVWYNVSKESLVEMEVALMEAGTALANASIGAAKRK